MKWICPNNCCKSDWPFLTVVICSFGVCHSLKEKTWEWRLEQSDWFIHRSTLLQWLRALCSEILKEFSVPLATVYEVIPWRHPPRHFKETITSTQQHWALCHAVSCIKQHLEVLLYRECLWKHAPLFKLQAQTPIVTALSSFIKKEQAFWTRTEGSQLVLKVMQGTFPATSSLALNEGF